MYSEKTIEQLVLTGRTVSDTVKRYIPQKLLQSVKTPAKSYENEEEVIQAYLSNSDNMLRMYGTARELVLNLKLFQNFPLSHRHFGFDSKAPYSTMPLVYENRDGVPFMNKADAFCLLQYINTFDRFKSVESFRLFTSMQAILLKSHEEKIKGICEFFKFDKDWLPKRQAEFIEFHQKFLAKESSKNCEDWNFEKALKMFKAVVPVWKEQEYCGFENELKAFFESNSGNFNEVSIVFSSFADYFKAFILAAPETFQPYDKKTNPNCPIVVRVFVSHGVQFVMKSELFNAINIRNPDSKRLEWKDINGKLMTMSYEEVQKEYKDRIENIEFVKYPIQRADHKAVPIMTPSGDHCILAADCLFEILNELIFSHRIFQKIARQGWHFIQRFVLQLSSLFSPHHKSIFFVTLEEQDEQEEELTKFWERFEHIPAKYVRNAKKDGFTVQNLKNELANLGLLELFPEIQNYAEAVYSEVFKTKKEEFLRTCDLFKAVEKCLLICIFKRFPTLRLFLHTQSACHLLPELKCDFCIPPAHNQFKNTNWTEPHYMKTLPIVFQPEPENTYIYEIELPDGTRLSNSYNEFFNMEQIRKHNIKYFTYDQQDLDHFSKNLKNLKSQNLQDKCRYSLDAFQKVYPEKKLYIRTIPSMRDRREKSKRVFTEEVLDLIPVVLRQQNTPIEESDDRLAKYRKKWATNNKEFETTISLTEFWYILEEFDVDKTRITICPDPVYEVFVQKLFEDLRVRTVNVIGPRGEQVMRSEQAVFYIFEVVVCSVNWSMDSCKKHENCLKELKDRIISSMRTYTEMDEGTYVSVEHVESVINQLKSHCSFQIQSKTPRPLAELLKRKPDDMISREEIFSNGQKFGLTRFMPPVEYMNTFSIATGVQTQYLGAWLHCFCDCETMDLYDVILDETGLRSIMFPTKSDTNNSTSLTPHEHLAALKQDDVSGEKANDNAANKEIIDLDIQKLFEINKNRGEPIIQKASQECTQKVPVPQKDLEVMSPSTEDNQKTSESEKAPVEKTASHTENIQKTGPIEKLPLVDTNQSKNCSKCSRTSEMCNEAKKELKSTQNKLEKYEKKAKRTDDVEKELKALKLVVKKREKETESRELEMRKKDTELEELKRNMLKLESKNAKMQLAEKNHSISQNELLEKITELSEQLKIEKERNDVLQSERINELTAQLENRNEKVELMELQIQQNEERLNSEIRQKERGFEELRAALRIMSDEKESIQRENRNLRERIASIPEDPPTPPVPESRLEGPTHHRFALLGFQKIKDSLYHKKQLKQAKEMIEKLKSSSDLVEIHQIADYEYYQFEGKLLKYSKEVELNIQRIKETRDVSMVTPLPDSPEFSKRFVNLYWRIINNQSITPSEIEISDSECFICTEEMASDQKTLQCEECKKVTHFECASKWLKIHRSCPHCRREMLNPEEFPNLGQ